jgi:hypothetical protein
MRALPTSRTPRVRHVLLTLSLVLAPVLITASTFMSLDVDFDSRADVVEAAASQPALWQTHQLIAMFGFMLLVPAVIAAAELVRRRSPALALASVILLGASAITITGAALHEWTLAAAAGLDVDMIAQYDTAVDQLGSIVVLFPLFYAGILGAVVLAVGLWRSKATHIWVPILLVASMIGSFVAPEGIASTITGLGFAVSFLGIAWSYWQSFEAPAPVAVDNGVDVEPPVVDAPG